LVRHKPHAQCLAPQLPDNPLIVPDAIDAFVGQHLADNELLGFIGSSMGGFFANVMAQRYQLPATLINPVVYPHQRMLEFLGDQQNPYTGAHYTLSADMLQPLEAMLVQPTTPRLVLVQEGDEVLDYREAQAFYRVSQLHVEAGGDHSFQGYENWLPQIASFFQL